MIERSILLIELENYLSQAAKALRAAWVLCKHNGMEATAKELAELVTTWTLSAENKDDPRKALQDIINWHVRVSLDPDVSSDACALIERGKAMRDEWRPASDPPEDDRSVLVWMPGKLGSPVTQWRDVQPPTEGA